MSLNNGITVRFDPAVRKRLEAIANNYGLKASHLIRQAIQEKLTEIETTGKIIFMNTTEFSPRNLAAAEDQTPYGAKRIAVPPEFKMAKSPVSEIAAGHAQDTPPVFEKRKRRKKT